MYTHWQKQKKTKETKNRQALKNQLYVNVGNQYKINTLTQTATQTNQRENADSNSNQENCVTLLSLSFSLFIQTHGFRLMSVPPPKSRGRKS